MHSRRGAGGATQDYSAQHREHEDDGDGEGEGDGEIDDDDDEEESRERETNDMLAEVTVKSGYLWKKGEKRKVSGGWSTDWLHDTLTDFIVAHWICFRTGRSVGSCCVLPNYATTRMRR